MIHCSELPTSQPEQQISAISQSGPNITTTAASVDFSSPRYADPASIPSGPVEAGVRSSVLGIPWKHLTKAERKRVEWERQRLEEQELKRQVYTVYKPRCNGNIPEFFRRLHPPLFRFIQ